MKLEKYKLNLLDAELDIFVPILELFINQNKFLKNLNPATFNDFQRDILKLINGQFLILASLKNKTQAAITDRWSSIPVFYNYRLKQFSREPDFKGDISETSLFSLFYARRLFSSSSLYKSSHRVNAGCIAFRTVDYELKVNQWIYRRFAQTRSHSVDPHCVAIRLQALAKEYSNTGLFISGGLDTRTLLAAGGSNWPHGLTIAFSPDSRELDVAKKLCELNKTEHKVQILDIDKWTSNIETAIHHSKFGYPINSLFSVMPDTQVPYVTGIGLDYMFQGMYLNPNMQNIPASIDNVLRLLPCGNRYIASNSDLHTSDIYNSLLREIYNIQSFDTNSREHSFIDLLRNIVFSDPSMHYSYTDYLSQSNRAPTSIIAFDPILDDLWQKIDYRQLFGKEFMLQTLSHINKDFLDIISANNNLPLRYNKKDRMKLYIRNGVKRIFSKRNLEHEVRTWPTQGYMAQYLLNLFGQDFFVSAAASLDFSWMRCETFINELKWFENRQKEFRFGRVHCDRENNFFYMLNILLVAD